MVETETHPRLAIRQSAFQTAALMPSQLWERLRHARRHADLTQKDIATAVGLTRSAVAQWEAAEPDQRTKPAVDHLIVVARLTKAPLEWLMNDASKLDDLYKLIAESDTTPAANRATQGAAIPGVLPDVRQGNQLFCFAQTPEQVAAKLVQLSGEDQKIEKHLVLIESPVAITTVESLADALTFVASKLDRRG